MAPKPSARRISLKRRKWRKFRRKLIRPRGSVQWLSLDDLEKWQEQQESQNKLKRKLSRRRGTPWYRHRDAWRVNMWLRRVRLKVEVVECKP